MNEEKLSQNININNVATFLFVENEFVARNYDNMKTVDRMTDDNLIETKKRKLQRNFLLFS